MPRVGIGLAKAVRAAGSPARRACPESGPVRQDRAGRSLGAAEARNFVQSCAASAGCDPSWNIHPIAPFWHLAPAGRSGLQAPPQTSAIAFSRHLLDPAGIGGPQPPPGGGPQLASRRSASNVPSAGCARLFVCNMPPNKGSPTPSRCSPVSAGCCPPRSSSRPAATFSARRPGCPVQP